MNHVTVFERPGLDEFLQQTSEFADLILFTAGLEGFFPDHFILSASFYSKRLNHLIYQKLLSIINRVMQTSFQVMLNHLWTK